jgi:hypothetical protein
MACNSGSKLCLHAGGPYFSIDETISGSYLVCVAVPRDWTAVKKEMTRRKRWKRLSQDINFRLRYEPRQILFRARSLEEAVHCADQKVENLIKYPKLLAA